MLPSLERARDEQRSRLHPSLRAGHPARSAATAAAARHRRRRERPVAARPSVSRDRHCCRRAAKCSNTACRASSAVLRKACSTRTTCAGAPTNLRISSKPRASDTASPRRSRWVIPTVRTSQPRCCCCGRSAGGRHPAACDGAAAPPPKADLAGKPVLIVSGQRDPIIPQDNSAKLAALLTEAGADVQHDVLPVGHELSQSDLALAKAWLPRARKSSARGMDLKGPVRPYVLLNPLNGR